MGEFRMCSHPELLGNPLAPARTIGSCPDHDYTCPVCGFGRGQAPPCGCGMSNVIAPVLLTPTSTIIPLPSPMGGSIMREDFITTTGPLLNER
jgi:hypothetical protein